MTDMLERKTESHMHPHAKMAFRLLRFREYSSRSSSRYSKGKSFDIRSPLQL